MRIGLGSPLVRAIAVAVVAIGMLIPLGMLLGLVNERTQMRQQAIGSVARGWGGKQLIGGALIAVPVSQQVEEKKWVTRDWYVLADTMDMDASVDVKAERRKVGVYEVPVYTTKVHARARFDLSLQVERFTAGAGAFEIHADRARVLVPVGDPRGLRSIALKIGGASVGALEPTRGFAIPALAAPLPAGAAGAVREIELDLEAAGTEALAFLPLARATSVRAEGNWPHPGFTSGFLPTDRQVTDSGFRARWQVLDLNRAYGSRWLEGDASEEDLKNSAFGVDLIQPVDLYQQVTRSVKYGALFVSLSLLTLFLFEQITRRALHPIEYGLMALALSVFYLLLLALAEQIGFAFAYVLAAAALCALLGVYLSGVLRSHKAGMAAGGIFAAVYGLLYLLVTSEDYALLAGSLALFALLAVLMVLTRKIDWYGSGSQTG